VSVLKILKTDWNKYPINNPINNPINMLRYLLEKEFKLFLRNKFLPILVIMLPFMILSFFPLIANLEIKNINLSIIDHDKSSLSQRLIEKLHYSPYFIITDISDSYANAVQEIELDKADVVLEIPALFEKSFINEKQSSVMIAASAVDGMKGSFGSSYLAGVIADFSQDIQMETIGFSLPMPASGFSVIPLYRYNPQLKYYILMIPALLVMMLTVICGFLPALNIVSEKEAGTIEQMNVTPVSKFMFILSKLIPYWVSGLVVLTVCIFVAWLFYNLFPLGSLFTLYLFMAIFILAISGFGLVVSNYATSIHQSIFIMFFFLMTFIFLSGLYTPFDNMPAWAQLLGRGSPLRYAIQVVRFIYLKGSSFSDMISQFLALCGLALFFNGWAVLSYRKRG
jgi:ABC-2 type transport system permease protein